MRRRCSLLLALAVLHGTILCRIDLAAAAAAQPRGAMHSAAWHATPRIRAVQQQVQAERPADVAAAAAAAGVAVGKRQSEFGLRKPMPASVAPPNAKLLQVQAVFRHGARTPQSTPYWPSTPYTGCDTAYPGVRVQLQDEGGLPTPPAIDKNGTPLPGGRCRTGQLTQKGFQQAVLLGRQLRERYILQNVLVPEDPTDTQVWLKTTTLERAVLTLQGVVTGMFPDLISGWAKGTVTAQAVPPIREYLYGKPASCAAMGPILQRLTEDLAELNRRPEEQRLQEAVSAALGLNPLLMPTLNNSNTATSLGQVAAGVGDPAPIPASSSSIPLPPPPPPLPSPPAFSWIRLHDLLESMIEESPAYVPPGATPDVLAIISDKALFEEVTLTSPYPSQGLATQSECDTVARLSIGPLLYRIDQRLGQAANQAQRQKQMQREQQEQKEERQQEQQEQREQGEQGEQEEERQQQREQQQQQRQRQRGKESSTFTEQLLLVDPAKTQGPTIYGLGLKFLRAWKRALGRLLPGASWQKDMLAEAGVEVAAAEDVGAAAAAAAAAAGGNEDDAAVPALYLYSGHDSTIMPLLYALGCPVEEWPHFTASITFELWQVPNSLAPLPKKNKGQGTAGPWSDQDTESKESGPGLGGKESGSGLGEKESGLGLGGKESGLGLGGKVSGSGLGGKALSGGPGAGESAYAVRVLYDGQPLPLPCGREGAGKLRTRRQEGARKVVAGATPGADATAAGAGGASASTAGAGEEGGQEGVWKVRGRLRSEGAAAGATGAAGDTAGAAAGATGAGKEGGQEGVWKVRGRLRAEGAAAGAAEDTAGAAAGTAGAAAGAAGAAEDTHGRAGTLSRLSGGDGWLALEDARALLSRLSADDERHRQECNGEP